MNVHKETIYYKLFEPNGFRYLLKILPRTYVPVSSKEITENVE